MPVSVSPAARMPSTANGVASLASKPASNEVSSRVRALPRLTNGGRSSIWLRCCMYLTSAQFVYHNRHHDQRNADIVEERLRVHQREPGDDQQPALGPGRLPEQPILHAGGKRQCRSSR